MAADPSRAKKRDILLSDPMAEAGRKILARQLRRMKSHQAGSRSGEDVESVHQMRVATRRMRSLFNLIGSDYRPNAVSEHRSSLRDIARALGNIRDLDVLILDLQDFQADLPAQSQADVQSLIDRIDRRRAKYRSSLNKLFDSKPYRRFLRQFERFCQSSGKGALRIRQKQQPHQVRHVLPLLLHERIARVKAYDTVLPASKDSTLHALRVEFKQLRYALEFFKPVLGAPVDKFLQQVKAIQETLGRINDIAVFTEYLSKLDDLAPGQEALVKRYDAARQTELVALRQRFRDQWDQFNNRATLRQFSDSLLVLR